MANDQVMAPLAQPQDIVAGRVIRAADAALLPGNLNAALARPHISVMDLRVPDSETPLFGYEGGPGPVGICSAPVRVFSPSVTAAAFSIKVTLRAEVVGVAGTLHVKLASGPAASTALPIGLGGRSVSVGPVAAPFDDLVIEVDVGAGGSIDGYGLAIEYQALDDPIPGLDLGDPGGPGVDLGDATPIDVAAVGADEPLDAALLSAVRDAVAHLYARPRPIYARVGFSSALSGQEHLGAHMHRIGFPPSVGATAVPTIWAYVHNTTDAPRRAFVYYGPAAGWPGRSVGVEIGANTKTWARFDLPVREGLDIASFDWPMAEVGYRSTSDMLVLSVSGGVA